MCIAVLYGLYMHHQCDIEIVHFDRFFNLADCQFVSATLRLYTLSDTSVLLVCAHFLSTMSMMYIYTIYIFVIYNNLFYTFGLI